MAAHGPRQVTSEAEAVPWLTRTARGARISSAEPSASYESFTPAAYSGEPLACCAHGRHAPGKEASYVPGPVLQLATCQTLLGTARRFWTIQSCFSCCKCYHVTADLDAAQVQEWPDIAMQQRQAHSCCIL